VAERSEAEEKDIHIYIYRKAAERSKAEKKEGRPAEPQPAAFSKA
jgi:hypothetical protein